MRRSVYAINRIVRVNNVIRIIPNSAIRNYSRTSTSQPTSSTPISQTTEYAEITIESNNNNNRPPIHSKQRHPQVQEIDIEVGDLVTYNVGASKTEGLVQQIFEAPFTDEYKTFHRASPTTPIAKIENYYTRQFSYHYLGALQWAARRHETESSAGQPKTQQRTTTQPPQAQGIPRAEQHHQQQIDKINQQLDEKNSPLNADFAPGDVVRFRVGANYTAGVILEIFFTKTYDDEGNFHNGSKENPIAKLENLWTKRIVFHHLDVLEHVKRMRDVTPGRFAESEYVVYPHEQ